ncbi:hypothetical protein LCL95_04690 [Bacillus timonensis]|nr:hypothetical protein [Bacillus timonensis]
MNKDAVRMIVEQDVEHLDEFLNYHGITKGNLHLFLVEPFEIFVDPDDLETSPRNMWVILQESNNIHDGFAIVYDTLKNSWGVSEHVSNDEYVMVIGAETLKEALEGM